jgi:hypothetical protein
VKLHGELSAQIKNYKPLGYSVLFSQDKKIIYQLIEFSTRQEVIELLS